MSEVLNKQLWLQAFQKKQLEKFMSRGMPTRKEENWKYTDMSFLATMTESVHSDDVSHARKNVDLVRNHAVSLPGFYKMIFINGEFSKELSNIENLPAQVTLLPLSTALHTHENLLKPHLTKEFDVQRFPFAALNSARMVEGVFLHIAKNSSVPTPIHIIYINTQHDKNIVSPRNILLADENAEFTVIEEYISDSEQPVTNVLTEINADNNARVNYYKIQDESLSATHVANIVVTQNKDSCVRAFTLSKGAKLSRDDVFLGLTAVGAECHLLGLYTLHHDAQHTDHHLHVDHAAEHGTSSMLYKGILDKKSKAVFNGKVFVHPKAQRTNSYQANHNLLLSKTAEVNTKPELEIYANDVKCTHGATVGQLDAESLFYLRSRGLNKDAAMRMLLGAFADEVISKIKNVEIRDYIQKRVGSYVE